MRLCPGCDAAEAVGGGQSGSICGPDNPSIGNGTLCLRCDLTVFFVKVSVVGLT